MKKISVIVPVYNVENYLKKCLDSLVEQTLKDIEIIIINDGSTDNSAKIINQYVEKYPKLIKAYSKKNGGLSSARNYGISKANGEYIGFVDSDDYVDKNMYKDLYETAKKEKSDIALCNVFYTYDSGECRYFDAISNLTDDIEKKYIISSPIVCNRIYKKEVFKENLFKLDTFYEDLNFNPGLISSFSKISYVYKPYYFYYQRTGSIMKHLYDIYDVLNNVKNSFKKSSSFNKYYLEIEYLYLKHLMTSAALRFIEYKECRNEISKISNIIRESFPKWYKNPYYKKNGIKFKFVCICVYLKLEILLKLAYKFMKKLK